jgi:hypothetical protein
LILRVRALEGIAKRRSQSAIKKPSAFIRGTQLPGAETPGAVAPSRVMRLGGRESASPMRRCDMSQRHGRRADFGLTPAMAVGYLRLRSAQAHFGAPAAVIFIASGRCIQETMHSCASNAISRALRGAAF